MSIHVVSATNRGVGIDNYLHRSETQRVSAYQNKDRTIVLASRRLQLRRFLAAKRNNQRLLYLDHI